jgi:hypothetical protein
MRILSYPSKAHLPFPRHERGKPWSRFRKDKVEDVSSPMEFSSFPQRYNENNPLVI